MTLERSSQGDWVLGGGGHTLQLTLTLNVNNRAEQTGYVTHEGGKRLHGGRAAEVVKLPQVEQQRNGKADDRKALPNRGREIRQDL